MGGCSTCSYVHDINANFVGKIYSRSDTDTLRSYDVLYDTFENSVHSPKLNIMDNKASKRLKRLL